MFHRLSKSSNIRDDRRDRERDYFPLEQGRGAAWSLADDDPWPDEERTRSKGRKRKWFVYGLAALLLVLLVLIGYLAITAPLNKSLQPIVPPQITLLASDGTTIARKGAIVDAPVEMASLPEHVVEPFLAIEDRRFYAHWGIDPIGLARAAVSNATGDQVQGGSTITQQLAKFTFLTPGAQPDPQGARDADSLLA